MSEDFPLETEFDERQLRRERLLAEFHTLVPKPFAHAAKELEFDKILEFHLKLSPGELGEQALVRELLPTSDVLRIDISLREISELRATVASDERPSFGGLTDIRPVLRKVEIEGSSLYIEEGVRILRAIKGMRSLREFFAKRASTLKELWKTAVHLYDDRLLEMHFASVFDDHGNVHDSASAELGRLRREIVHTTDQLRAKLTSILRRLTEDAFVQEEIITQREGRFVIPVKVEHKRRVPGFIHSVSQSGHTVFIEPSETLDLNNEIRSLAFAEQREIERILAQLAVSLRAASPEMQKAIGAAAHIESVFAKARYAEEQHAQPAIIHQRGEGKRSMLRVVNARHPLLLRKLGREHTVPLTLELGNLNHTLVLTGPNAGGKTVVLKTIGLLILMAQAGLPIPADADAELPMVDALFVEIGDSQSLADDLSTFSSHITALARILKSATNRSLILLDEIGGGTAPEEGGALAESMLEYLTKLGAYTIATTHFGRLAAFADSTKGALNGSMEFSSETLTPTFRFKAGVPGSSHAFEIAERYGLPKAIISRAGELRGLGSTRLDDLIHSLEQLQAEAAEKKREADRELAKTRVAKVDYERKRDEALDIRRTAKAKAVAEAEDVLKRANSFIERAVREAKEAAHLEASGKSNEEDLRRIRARQESERRTMVLDLEVAKKEVEPKTTVHADSETKQVVVGSAVELKSNPGQRGEVVAIKGNEAEVLIGGMRVRAKLDRLEVVAKGSSKTYASREVSQATKFLASTPESRIDLRGEYSAEALPVVERFLSDAAAHSLERVEIIHGMGTGALGRKIGEYLKGHALVLSYRYGEPSEGGAGVTIVELK